MWWVLLAVIVILIVIGLLAWAWVRHNNQQVQETTKEKQISVAPPTASAIETLLTERTQDFQALVDSSINSPNPEPNTISTIIDNLKAKSKLIAQEIKTYLPRIDVEPILVQQIYCVESDIKNSKVNHEQWDNNLEQLITELSLYGQLDMDRLGLTCRNYYGALREYIKEMCNRKCDDARPYFESALMRCKTFAGRIQELYAFNK